jgi:hypothetical protein
MLAPVSAAAWALHLGTAWNAAEASDVRKNSRTARELIVALPAELEKPEQIKLAHQLGQDLVDRYAVAVLVAVHAPDAKSDERNVHVHLLMSTRVAGADGYGAKVRILDDQKSGPREAEAIRDRVALRINEALARNGMAHRVDPRPLRDQALSAAIRGDLDAVVELSRTPTRHQGAEASAVARRGEQSPVVTWNNEVRQDNAAVRTVGLVRVAQMRATIQTRATEWAQRAQRFDRGNGGTARGNPRQQRMRNGIGPVGKLTKATGMDAQLLNQQARVAEATAQVVRDTTEAYLDSLARELAQQQASVNAYLISTGAVAPEGFLTSLTGRPLDTERLDCAAMAHAAWMRAQQVDEESRRLTAQAELTTARVRKTVDDHAATGAPPAWRVRTKREWAAHRRSHRAALAAAEAKERERRTRASGRASEASIAEHAWREAHEAFIAGAISVPLETTRSAKAPHLLRNSKPTLSPSDSLVSGIDGVLRGTSARQPDDVRRGPADPVNVRKRRRRGP